MHMKQFSWTARQKGIVKEVGTLVAATEREALDEILTRHWKGNSWTFKVGSLTTTWDEGDSPSVFAPAADDSILQENLKRRLQAAQAAAHDVGALGPVPTVLMPEFVESYVRAAAKAKAERVPIQTRPAFAGGILDIADLEARVLIDQALNGSPVEHDMIKAWREGRPIDIESRPPVVMDWALGATKHALRDVAISHGVLNKDGGYKIISIHAPPSTTSIQKGDEIQYDGRQYRVMGVDRRPYGDTLDVERIG